MAQENRSRLLQYAVPGGAALLCALIVAWARGVFAAADAQTVFGLLSDGFMVPGLLLAGAGGLSFAASKGAYDAFGYAFSRFSLHSLFTTRQTYRDPESFYEYKVQRNENRRPWSPVLLITGLCALVLSGLCLVGYALA